MTADTITAEARERLHAYFDGELDTPASLDFERQLEASEPLRCEYDALVKLRRGLRDRVPRRHVPDDIRAQVAALGQNRSPAPQRTSVRSWGAMAASALLAAVASAMLTFVTINRHEPDIVTHDVVASYVRANMATSSMEVSSSDRHTVKPWFTNKLPYSPTVLDLTAAGFPLVGGRLDYVAGRPVAALVYRHRLHLINLYVWPAGADILPNDGDVERGGYSIVHWSEGAMTFWAISDINRQELDSFRRAHREASIETPSDR